MPIKLKIKNNGEGDENRLARNRGEHAEIKNDDDGDENPKEEKKFALRNEIGLAGFVDKLGNLSHGAMHGHVLEAGENGHAEQQAENADADSKQKKLMSVNAEKGDRGEDPEAEDLPRLPPLERNRQRALRQKKE